MRIISRIAASALIVLALAAALSACGGGNNDSTAPEESMTPSQQLVIKASNWQFDQPEYTIPKDTPVEIKLVNEQGAHGLLIEGANVKLHGGKWSKVVKLAAGTYEIKCATVCGTGHLTMTSKLIVQ
ncbi:cytochrome C oxidase subunit II [Cohnella lubricantis]|uniref:Cytochrome C oxidase subunit II n=1 Tax=Cohnella lubricantis TaxID=2163172 RepID=A0A841TDQ8_9BACL|nr:cytochrome C oxidase subunit II [Cohnella lubricantis]MBB6678356.1 cytochrome C oxidase subunit II [Cohnella lubricantis]MBP2116736.1 cytochrome c oxidase subunit 2 [Cohnella lubricantis]